MPEREKAREIESARRKSELVATVSHELRTPLASVLGFLELVLDRELDEDTRHHYLETVHSEAQRLAALIDDFLDLEKIEAGAFTLKLESLDMGELLQQQVELFAGQSVSHSLDLVAPAESLIVVGDRVRIGQVIANLLSNAIKYSPAGGPVTVTARAGDGFAHVQVSDSGLGIPASQRDQVFKKFFRVDSSDTREIGGTGLGLALCEEIVTAHGGRIGFTTTEGAGSTFWFELPHACGPTAEMRGPRVLIVENDLELAKVITHRLQLAGLETETVATGKLALERALAKPRALICLDADISGPLDGWQVLVRLKASPGTAHVPVIVWADDTRRRTAATLGAAGFVPKPATAERVREAVSDVLSAKSTSVLIVAEDQALRRLIVATLARDGGDMREATDGIEALGMIGARQPDALVLDLALPGNNGFGDIEQVLERPEAHGVPVVVLTGRKLSARERRFLRERNASLLEKSTYSGEQLRRLVRQPRFASSTLAILGLEDIPSAATQLDSPLKPVGTQRHDMSTSNPIPGKPKARSHAD